VTNATLTWLVLTIVVGMVALAFVLQLAGRDGRPLGLRAKHWFFLALCVGLFGMAGASLFAYLTTTRRLRDQDLYADRFMALIGLMDALKDSERGEMGFLLTGRDSYKAPYTRARPHVAQHCERLKAAYADSDELPRVDALCRLTDTKLRELDRSIGLREKGEGDKALALLSTDAGRNTMERAGDHAAPPGPA
jgi:CHASE3 domain sensor protein